MKQLQIIKKKHSGRDATGKVSVRHQGGGNKRFLRLIDFRRDKEVAGKVIGIEYDPNRNSEIALIQYADGDKRYILCPVGLHVGDAVASGDDVDIKPGNALPLGRIPMGTFVHNVELTAGKGGQMGRGAGTQIIVGTKDGNAIQIKLPSGELRKVLAICRATVGQVGNITHKDKVVGKAGTKRHMGIRPTVRGVAQNPRSHPHGGGEGRSGIGMSTPKTYAGRAAVGNRRRPNKYSDKYIITSRKK